VQEQGCIWVACISDL